MFTFSFSSAFAATDLTTVVESNAEAVKAITDKADGYLADITTDLNKLVSEYNSFTGKNDISKEAYTAVLEDLAETAANTVKTQKVNALNELAAAEKAITDANQSILGYIVKDGFGTVDPGYVNVYAILSKIADPDFADNALKTVGIDRAFAVKEFDLVKDATLKAIQAVDPSVYSTTDKVGSTDKSSYETAVDTKRTALVEVNDIKVVNSDDADAVLAKINAIKALFAITGKGTAGEKYTGTYGAVLEGLKKATTDLTDEKKMDYAKTYALAEVKAMIEKEKADLIGAQNAIIFAQQVSAKPNQKVIDAANKEIDRITKDYDALLEVWTYRLTNADYKVVKANGKEYIDIYYGDTKLGNVGNFTSNVFVFGTGAEGINTVAKLNAKLAPKTALEIATAVDELEKEAAAMKGNIAVDGNVYVNVDDALAKAIKKTYMTGTKPVLTSSTANYEAHDRVHELLGADATKVTVDGKKYDTVNAWDDKLNLYDETKAKEVKAIVKEATAALKATKTVAEADAAFLAAYAKFDAVMTRAEHDAMFVYGGSLYEAFTKAVAEINAYVSYKYDVMGDTYPAATKATLQSYFTNADTGVLFAEVYSADDLTAKVAEAKATIDALKTKKELKEMDSALAKKVLEVKVPVTAEAKDSIVALYKEIKDFEDYCDMVGYSNNTTTVGLPRTYVEKAADLDEEAMDKIVEEIYKDGKITLEDKPLVEQLAAAAKAYEDLYVTDLKVAQAAPTFSYTGKITNKAASYFEDEIFNLEVEAAATLIKALPASGATAAQIKAAKAAVEALGFDGICSIDRTLLTKLNRLEQNLALEVTSLKIKASSKATKGAMTIKWRVIDGNKDAAAGYQVWRSTKANKGFKKMITTKKMTYKNTKNLKKGTTYYYRVRAYAEVDGKVYFSDYSNKAYRKAK